MAGRGVSTRLVGAAAIALAVTCTVARAQSAVDGFSPGANNIVEAVAVQPDGKILVGGRFTGLGGGTGTTTRNRIGRLNADGSVDSAFDPGANDNVLGFALQPDGKILVGGHFTMLGGGGTGTTNRSSIGRLNANGTLDTSFNPGANGDVHVMVVQPDGKILVAGSFTTLGGGGTGTTTRNRIGRLNADGSLDTSFDPGANGRVKTVVVQADGKIVLGGDFTTLGGGGTGTTTRNNIGRLNADGSLDTSFNPGINPGGNEVNALALQADGKILVGGFFTGLGGGTGTTARRSIGRLNPDGSVDAGFNPGADAHVDVITVQPDGKILVGGEFAGLGGGTGTTTRNNIGRLNPDGSLDAGFNPGADSAVKDAVVQPDGKIVLTGYFGKLGGGGTGTSTRQSIGRLYNDGSLDATLDPGANGSVTALAVLPDGKILVGGLFTMLGGGTGTTVRNNIGRLNPDGALDTSFNPGANGAVNAIVVQPDGRILLAGSFTSLGGGGTGTTTRNRIGRLNADGSLDTSFNPGANAVVQALGLQPDGKIVVGGQFTTLGGGGTGTTPRSYLGRLNADGSVDTSFNPGATGPAVATLALQHDGKILVGGFFQGLGGGTGTTTRFNIGRLNSDGSLDTAFNPGTNLTVQALAVQPDGKILVGGQFQTMGGGGSGTLRNYIGRLNADGSVDIGFNPGANHFVTAFAVQPDGRILVAGTFTTLGGGGTGTTTRNRIGRLIGDGSLDTGFNPGVNNTVYGLASQADGRILIGGDFTTLGSGGTGTTPRNRIGRLTNDGAALQNLTVASDGSIVTWLRSGTGPEVSRVTFESSTDGSAFLSLGSATRVADGWQLTGPSVPFGQNVYIRGRGYAPAGYGNGTSSIVESIRNAFFTCAAITLSPTTLPGGMTAVAYTTTLTQTGGVGTVTFAVTSGALPGGLTLSSAGVVSGMPTTPGTFNFTVTATGSNTCTGSRAYTVTVTGLPTVALDKTALQFAATSTGTAFTQQTQGQTVRLLQFGSDTVTWTATPSHPWITVSPTAGTGSATLTVNVAFSSSLPIGGTSNGTIALAFTGAANTAGPITVALKTIANGASTVPTGVLDTPVDGIIGVTGSIAVTGWAIDDVEVTRVRILRDPVAGEGAAQIFIGTAVFVDGARPDVAALNPNVPRHTRAGWGYLLLTNFLPGQGNGTFKLYAYADDADGHTALLGSKTITCTNSTATKPFGAIDTPAQGDVISGASYNNFGWVLSRGPALAYPPNGTVQVVVDGIFLPAAPTGWVSRSDLTALFPASTYPGIANALGVATLDTTTLANGVHTIAWVVTADNGQADGIGSRYFSVANGSSSTAGDRAALAWRDPDHASAPKQLSLVPSITAGVEVDAADVDSVAEISGRRGWDVNAPLQTYAADPDGRVTVTAEELDRIELHVGKGATGYMRVGSELGPLPIGSHLDPVTGVFTWHPSVGFLRTFDFVFARSSGGRVTARQDVRIVINPRGSNRVGTQVVIDTPAQGASVTLPFVVAGWALDGDAAAGTGVEAVHVWAYPIDGQDPIFLGATAYGGARPDVAALFGSRFEGSAYGLTVGDLPPGTYDVAVFAWSTATGRFAPARVVRVTVR